MIVSNRMTIYEDDHLQLDLEYTEHYAILHLPKMKMNKTTYVTFLTKVPELYQFLSTAGYEAVWTAIDPEDKLTKKLLDRLGARMLGNGDGLDVYEYRGVN